MSHHRQEEPPPSFVAGLFSPDYAFDAATLLQIARADGYDFCLTTLALPSDGQSDEVTKASHPRTDLCRLDSSWWATSVVGMIPFTHSPNPKFLSLDEEAAIERMVRWACHMSVPAIIIPCPDTNTAPNMDSSLITRLSLIASAHNLQLWINLRLLPSDIEAMDALLRKCASGSSGGNIGICLELLSGSEFNNGNSYTQFEIFQMLHKIIGMNLKAIFFNTKSFMTNKRGYPTLSKTMQTGFTYVLKRLGRTIRVFIAGKHCHSPMPLDNQSSDTVSELVGESGFLPYLQYLRHLRQRQDVKAILDTSESKLESSYLDHLQSPLQPLGDDLEYATYETFEKDPVKYSQYERAIFEALKTLMHGNNLTRVNKDVESLHYATIFVLGAGRGPLVQRALNAVSKINTTTSRALIVRVVAIDKNPNAILYLKSMLASKSNKLWTTDKVKIIQCDMRNAAKNTDMKQWQNDISIGRAYKVDLLVSELLGSFGDNELSPECLEGAIDAMNEMNLLHNHCISIPQRYTSYIAPISSVRLHAEAKAQAFQTPSSALDGPLGQSIGGLKAMETPYVVRTHAASQTHTEKPVFDFQHKSFGGRQPLSVDRFSKKTVVKFYEIDTEYNYETYSGYGRRQIEYPRVVNENAAFSQCGVTIHGLLGTFDAQLFGDIHISISPNNFSTGMFSWFPLYFPLIDPIFIPTKASLKVSIWRKFDSESNRVWYEWGVDVIGFTSDTNGNISTKPQFLACSTIHNPGGRSYHVRL